MTFEQTLQFLADHTGKTVDVDVALVVEGRSEPVHVAGFSGLLDRLSRSEARALPEAWYAGIRQHPTGPAAASIRLDRELFEAAEAHANVPEDPNERGEFGTTWTLTIRQGGVLTMVEFYV